MGVVVRDSGPQALQAEAIALQTWQQAIQAIPPSSE